METLRTFDLLERYSKLFSEKKDVFAAKENGKWQTYSVEDYISNSNNISYGLLSLGLKKGDRIATISNNRPEWNFVDMGLAQAGFIHVPIFTTLKEKGYKDIFDHAGVSAVFVSDKDLYEMVKPIAPEMVFTFDEVAGAKNWKEVVKLGIENSAKFEEQIKDNKEKTSPKNPVTLIYTSGTTGTPKGVLLSHENLVSNAKAAAGVFNLQPNQRYLSILPICHVGERMGSYQTQYSGCSIYYAKSLTTLAGDLKEVKPHGFGAVPRILEKVFDSIIAKGNKLTGIKKKLFFWALNLGLNYEINGKGAWYKIQLKLANKLIFSKWREALGGNVESIGIGGAALQPRLEKVFWAAGIKLLNMYGLTETSPIITINRIKAPLLKFGSVGAKIEDVEVRISGDGEILCKGPNVMIGYYKDEKATQEVLDKDGWFHTGDIGKIDEDGFLHITDRKKEIFKLSNGKYVSPQAIENLFKESVYIDQVMVTGDGEKFASAIISPNFEAVKEWCRESNVPGGNNDEIADNSEVKKLINGIIKEYNKSLNDEERVKQVRIVTDSWTPDSGELSPTLKLKRRILNEKYSTIINDIYKKEAVLGV